MSDPLCGRKVVANMCYRLCGRNEAQNSRSDPYADGTRKKSSVHKCQNLAILDRTLLSIRQGPDTEHKPKTKLLPSTFSKFHSTNDHRQFKELAYDSSGLKLQVQLEPDDSVYQPQARVNAFHQYYDDKKHGSCSRQSSS